MTFKLTPENIAAIEMFVNQTNVRGETLMVAKRLGVHYANVNATRNVLRKLGIHLPYACKGAAVVRVSRSDLEDFKAWKETQLRAAQ